MWKITTGPLLKMHVVGSIVVVVAVKISEGSLIISLLSCSICSYEFLRTNATELVDGGREQVMRQQGFQLINPTEKWFPGITELRNNFESWAWRYGKTPAFVVERKVPLKKQQQQQVKSQEDELEEEVQSKRHEMKLRVDVKEGLIDDIKLVLGGDSSNADSISVVSQLKGAEYNEDNFNAIYDSLKTISPDAIMAQAINGS